jgi:hypothetical protein
MCHVYIARDLNYIGGTTDETEEFEVVVMSPAANHKEHGMWTKRWIHAMTTPVFVLLLTSCGGGGWVVDLSIVGVHRRRLPRERSWNRSS